MFVIIYLKARSTHQPQNKITPPSGKGQVLLDALALALLHKCSFPAAKVTPFGVAFLAFFF